MKFYLDRIEVFDHTKEQPYLLFTLSFKGAERLLLPLTPNHEMAIQSPLIWSICYRLKMLKFRPKKYEPLSRWFNLKYKAGRVISRADGLHYQLFDRKAGKKMEFSSKELNQLIYRFWRLSLWRKYDKVGRKKGSGKKHSPNYYK